MRTSKSLLLACVVLFPAGALMLSGCGDSAGREQSSNSTVESCMLCHNGSKYDDYTGPGLENPHPFPGADSLTCTVCHGGNGEGVDRASSHVPPPPEIGDREQQRTDRRAWFNKLTLSGMDKFPDYTVDGVTYTALDFLQFVNPGDLRVVNRGRSCGVCHEPHAERVSKSLLATEAGIFSGAGYAAGMENVIEAHRGLHGDTAADLGFRAVQDPGADTGDIGTISELLEYPVFSVRNDPSPDAIHDNPIYDSPNLPASLESDNSVRAGSPLANLYREQVAFTCGDCHLGSAGANNRYGDFRSSGCTSCHMPYSLDGRSRSRDPNVPKDEPFDPDDIDEPERSHVRAHRIVSTKQTLENGAQVSGMDDYVCAGCHQGSNRTVMQYWGIRLDQNQDLRRGVQYPANPVSWQNTSRDERLFDSEVRNRTFNGRNANQYILYEDYDGDDRDDTPADVHYEAGMGCIDCHGSVDLHGDGEIHSRQEQQVAITCESCHGGVDTYAATITVTDDDGTPHEVAVDRKGNPLRHVERDTSGQLVLTSKLTGQRHFVVQTRDTVFDSGARNPFTDTPVYSPRASFAMGRDDGDPATGIGPQQGATPGDFCHSDTMDCASCHAAWTNTCMGCHLDGEYNGGNNFSNITGERIVFREDNADFVYQSPVFFQLGVDPSNRITQTSSNTKVFFSWRDRTGTRSQVFAFSDRNGKGNDPTRPYPALGHNAMMAHSIRPRVTETQEGPRYCVACHLTRNSVDTYGDLYTTFRDQLANDRFDLLDFGVLRDHLGKNPGNQIDSPLWVHMVAGLGSGLFLFDENGCPTNPLDNDTQRKGCEGVAPASIFDSATVLDRAKFHLDRVVDLEGIARASSNHPLMDATVTDLRDGADDPNMAGPLGRTLVRRLTDPDTGIVLENWIDADGQLRGGAGTVVNPPAAQTGE